MFSFAHSRVQSIYGQNSNSFKRYAFADIEGNSTILSYVLDVIATYKPTHTVFLGDILETYNYKDKFNKSVNDLRSIFNALNIDYKTSPRYNTINDVYVNFINDLQSIMVAKQFDIFEPCINFNYAQIPRDKFYNYEPHDNINNVFVVGNKEVINMHAMINNENVILDHYTDVNNNTTHYVKIITKIYNKHLTTENKMVQNDYCISLDDANLLYKYFSMCRIAFYEYNVLYMHYGGNASKGSNSMRVMINGTQLKPRRTIAGHEKICGIVKNYNVYNCYIDCSSANESYENYKLQRDDVFATVDETGFIHYNNKHYIINKYIDDITKRSDTKMYLMGKYESVELLKYAQ